MDTILLGRDDVAGLLDMRETIRVVEQAFRYYAAGQAQMPPKTYIQLEKGDFRAMPCSLPGAAGIKWVNVHPGNPKIGLPTVMAVFVYNDPDTGFPLAIMDATDITSYRTAAASACASRYLARPDSRTLGLIGAGRQANFHLLSHAALFELDEVRVFDIKAEAVDSFMSRFPELNVVRASVEEAVASDIVCTLTPAVFPVVKASWVKRGTHINAVGADAPGKEELEPAVLGLARVVVDDLEQASHGGEINVPLSSGLYKTGQIWATLDQVITGVRPGRDSADQITVFDSTGLAIEDLAVAQLAYGKAAARGGYTFMAMVQSPAVPAAR